jgi:hypothetical protein
VLSGPVAATIVAPDGRTISYSDVTGQYASQVPGVIARRGVRQGNTNDPGGLFAPIDVMRFRMRPAGFTRWSQKLKEPERVVCSWRETTPAYELPTRCGGST